MQKKVIPKPDSGKNSNLSDKLIAGLVNVHAALVRRGDAKTRREFGSPIADEMTNLEKRVDEIKGRIAQNKSHDFDALKKNVGEFAEMLRELASQNPHCKFEISVENKSYDHAYGVAVVFLNINPQGLDVRASDQYVFSFGYGGVRVFNLTKFEGSSSGSLFTFANASSEHVSLWLSDSAKRVRNYDPKTGVNPYLWTLSYSSFSK